MFRRWALCLALPCTTLALRFRAEESEGFSEGDLSFDLEELESMVSLGASMSYDARMNSRVQYGVGATANGQAMGDNSTGWPDNWMVAHNHGHVIAHMLNNETLWNFTHAYTGPPDRFYQAQTMAMPEFNMPAIKMQHAVPGWEPRTKSEAQRTTEFPTYLALASSWDKDLVYDVALAVAEEFKTLGANVMFGPAINIHRATQHDEEFDSLSGEDPTLGSVLVRAWILGAQTHGIMSVPKFFGRAEQTPAHFENASANVTSWDIYYPPFEQAIDCGAAGIMCASHEVNGLWSCRDSEMLERDLKGIMGFNGMVISGDNSAREYFPYASSFEKGLDLEVNEKSIIPWSEHMEKGMRKAATRVAAAIWHMKLQADPGCQPPDCQSQLSRVAKTPDHLEVAKKACGSGIILLKNEMNLLPLKRDRTRTVAVIGPAATTQKYCVTEIGVPMPKCETPFHALKAHAADKGINVIDRLRGAQVCVVIGGHTSHATHWSVDKETQAAIEDAIVNCPQLVVFLELSGSVLTPWRENVQSLAVIFHSGEETGFGWAATLFGDYSPSGKLPLSFPEDSQDLSNWWTEAVPSYWSSNLNFAFPFGHGLSYANFEYFDIKEKSQCHFPVCVMVSVRNTSPSDIGAEVVQLYVKFGEEEHHPAVLRAFHKTKVLSPGESAKVFFPLTTRDISLYHDVGNKTEAEKSWSPMKTITVLVGSSSKDIRKTLTVRPRLR